MDFFEHQAQARRRTRVLVFWYAVAVLLIVLGVCFATAFALIASGADLPPGTLVRPRVQPGFLERFTGLVSASPELFLAIGGLTIFLIVAGTLYKLSVLAAGGSVVARSLGGAPVSASSADPDERRLMNVVEEMAIASGVPMPRVYLLHDERSINAFAAGYTTADAVIGVSKGALEKLNREELQGVIAHEYSHILNGDMRLNIRLIGILHGILMIALFGQILVRAGARLRGRNNPGPIVVVWGVLLIALGYVGVLVARAIKAGVSRQREFLADAAAVQFTRNPHGIAQALRKVGGLSGSRIAHSGAEEVSHCFFLPSSTVFFAALFATHPPLTERISRLEGRAISNAPGGVAAVGGDARVAGLAGAEAGITAKGRERVVRHEQLMGSLGTISSDDIVRSQAVLNLIDGQFSDVLHSTRAAAGAIAAVIASFGDHARLDEGVIPEDMRASFSRVKEGVLSLESRDRIQLFLATLPVLYETSPSEYSKFKKALVEIARHDGSVNPIEYGLISILHRVLDAQVLSVPLRGVSYRNVSEVRGPIEVVLTVLARYHADASHESGSALKRAGRILNTTFKMDKAPHLHEFDAAVEELISASPALKRLIFEAAVSVVEADGIIDPEEEVLVRVIGAALGVPIPLTLFDERLPRVP